MRHYTLELENRLAKLLDGQRDRRTRVSQPVSWTVAASLLGGIALAGTTRLVAVADDQPASESSAASTEVIITPATQGSIDRTDIPKVDLENAALHRGVVVGPDGKPLAGAAIYAASTIELLELDDAENVGVEDLGPIRAMTDAQGRFEFNAQDLTWVTTAGERKRWESLLVATKEGVVPGWLKTWGDDRSLREHWHPMQSREVAVRTRLPATLTGQLRLEGGTPLVGARVRLTGLMAPVEYDLEKHVPKEEKHALGLFEGVDYAETLYRPWVLPGLNIQATTDDDGRFELPGLPEGFIAQIEVTHPEAVTTSLRVAVRSIEPVYRKAPFEQGEPTITLYGSGFTAELPKGMVLRGHVTTAWEWNREDAAGVTVALANHNAKDGMYGQRFKTDAKGRFEVTGLQKRPQGYELAFAGSFRAPYGSRRQQVAPGENAEVSLVAAAPYRLKLLDAKGNPVDREVYSIEVQQVPGESRRNIKGQFNHAERVGPGVYQGIVPLGPAAVLVKRGATSDRPATVDPKAFFAPGRTDWAPEEERYAYGDAWRIAQPAVVTTEALSVGSNWTTDQLKLAAVVFTEAKRNQGVLELTATVQSDPPVDVTLVDDSGQPVDGARLERQLEKYNEEALPATFSIYGLHPDRAEFLKFTHDKRGLIGTLSTTWTNDPVQVIMQPAATLIGRLSDAAKVPNLDFGIRMLGKGVTPDTIIGGRMHNLTDKPGERTGEFRLTVPPGVEVRGEFVRMSVDRATRPSAGAAFGPLIPMPGETVHLGDLAVP